MVKPVKKTSLGRGLSTLLGPDLILNQDGTDFKVNKVISIPLDAIQAGPYQPRKRFQSTELDELAESIKEIGVLQPILARQIGVNRYEIIAGERRWRAAQQAGLSEIPALIKDFSDEQASEAALIENVQRDDLTPLEEARGYKAIIDKFGYTQEQLSTKIGKSRSHIANTLRLLSLPENIKALIDEGKISAGHGRILLTSQNPEELAKEIIEKKLNVRDVEKRNKATRNPQERLSSQGFSTYKPKDEDIQHLEEQISQILGLRTQIELSDKSGQLIISFATLQELDHLIGKLAQAS